MRCAHFILSASLSLLFSSLHAYATDAVKQPAIGRLFFTPAERASLDIIRQNSKAPDKIITAIDQSGDSKSELENIPVESTKPVTLQGYVGRSDGKNTVWVNNQAMSEKTATRELSVGKIQKNNGQVQITITGTEKKSISLKAGQIYDPNSDKIYNYAKDVPEQEPTEAKPQSILENISNTLNISNLKNKATEAFSFLTNPEKNPGSQTPASP